MSKIANAVQEFLKEMEWEWKELDQTRYRLTVPGNDGGWTWVVGWEEDDSFVGCYSFSPLRVPTKNRPAVAEYLMRANSGLRLGNFEMDYSDGEVSFKTSAPTKSIEPDKEFIKTLAISNFSSMERYLPGLMGVAFGKVSPIDAVLKAEGRPEQAPPENAAEGASVQGAETGGPPQELESAPGRVRVRLRRLSPPAERRRRVAQIARLLRMMGGRAHNEVKGSCFMVVSSLKRKEGEEPAPGEETQERMVQFCFEKDWFAIDIPNTVLQPEEANKVLRERSGFYREAKKPSTDVTTSVEELVQFNPVGKKYIYGDEREAAEDAAFVLFTVGDVALNRTLYITASAFGDGPNWEKEEPLV
jgi:hypothetical protein